MSLSVDQYFNEIDKPLSIIGPSGLGLQGPFCFQVIVPEDRAMMKVIELNPRFGGGYPIADKAGNTMVHWLIEEAYSLTKTHSPSWENNSRMLRYDDAIFVWS